MPKTKTSAKISSKKSSVKKTVAKAKSQQVSPIPDGYHSVTPYLIVNNGKDAIEFYKKAFAANAVICIEQSDGKIGHAELTIGNSKVMMADECPEMGAFSPNHYKGAAVSLHLYVQDVDAVVQRAIDAGATLTRPVDNMFYGDRSGGIVDPFGHHWYISTNIEKVSLAEIRKRATERFGK
jgi:PhnB protein